MTKKPSFSVVIPPNTLKVKADRPGGITRGEAAEIAASVVAQAAAAYRAITARDVEELEALAAAAAPGEAEARRRFFRKAHDLWALGDTFGYPLVTAVAGSLLTYIDGVGDAAPLDRAIVLLHIQALRMIVAGRVKGAGDSAVREMVDGLAKAVAKALGAPSA